MKVKGNVFVVTGAANGIGRQVVLTLLNKGGRVAALDIDTKGLTETFELSHSYKDRLTTYPCDITQIEDIEKVITTVKEDFKHVDALINVAGVIQPFIDVIDLDFPTIKRVMNINFYGTVNMVKVLLPLLMNRPSAHIVNVSSMGGFVPIPGQSAYGASKAAVKLFTEGLYAELINSPVRVTLVYPGAVQTEITKNSGVELNVSGEGAKMLSATKCAQMIIKAMEKNKFRVLAGQDAKMLDLLSRLSPKKATLMIAKKMKALKEQK